MKDNAEETSSGADDNSAGHYLAPSSVRNLIFVWEDGKRLFLNYSYLVSCELSSDNNLISLAFTNCQILIKGIKLNELFELLAYQQIRIVKASSRYTEISDTEFKIESLQLIS